MFPIYTLRKFIYVISSEKESKTNRKTANTWLVNAVHAKCYLKTTGSGISQSE